MVQVLPEAVLPSIPDYVKKELFEHDYDAERSFRERGEYRAIEYISCSGLVRNKERMEAFRRMLQILQETYQYPVDVEFTINFSKQGEFVVNLLQCRPLQAFRDSIINARLFLMAGTIAGM